MVSTEKRHDVQPHLPPSGNLAPDNERQLEQPKTRVNGGLDAWLNVLAGFCVFVNSWLVYIVVIVCLYQTNIRSRGLLTTYGAFQEYYQTELLPNETPSTISWVGSIQATLIPMVGLAAGPLVDVGYLRPLIIAGSFLTVFGMMMTSLATSYYQVNLKSNIGRRLSYENRYCSRKDFASEWEAAFPISQPSS